MGPTYRAPLQLRIIGYFNSFFIFLGLTRIYIDFSAQRVVQSQFVGFYVNCANIASLVFMPISYTYDAFEESSEYVTVLEIFSDTVNVLINFGAVAFSVLFRGQREGIHLEIAETIITLDRSYFSRVCSDRATQTHVNCLLYFKLVALSMQTFVPIYDLLKDMDGLDAYEVLHTCYYVYMQNILAASLFMYFYMLWLLQRRFCLLNMQLKNLLRQLQQIPIKAGLSGMNSSAQQRIVADATLNLVEITKIHTRLSQLLERLNNGYKQLLPAVLLANLIDNISSGYYVTFSLHGYMEWELDFETISFFSYTIILFVDLNSVYWISDMTMLSHRKMAQILRRFQILSPLGDGFEQQCELFALQLQLQSIDPKIAGLFQLNRKSALALWTFAMTNIIVFMQFDLGAHLSASKENPILDRFNKFFRIEWE